MVPYGTIQNLSKVIKIYIRKTREGDVLICALHPTGSDASWSYRLAFMRFSRFTLGAQADKTANLRCAPAVPTHPSHRAAYVVAAPVRS